MPILIPILALDQVVTRRRKLAALAATCCVVCAGALVHGGAGVGAQWLSG
ncbi:MAG: hypothetical protein ACRYHQ_23355 [Janthinobacterium lividum]